MSRTYYKWVGDYSMRPEAGESSSLGYSWEECSEDKAEYMEVPITGWGDYGGSTVERSNYEALLEDYPDTFVEVYGGYNSQELRIPMDKLTEELAEIFDKLEDEYPLYNDEHHSLLEHDLAWESWEQWLSYDVYMYLREQDLPVDDWEDKDLDFIKQRYYTLTYEQDYGPECEDAVSAFFPFDGKVCEQLAEEINTLGLEHDPRRPNPNDPKLPGV